MLKSLASLALLFAIAISPQNTPKVIALTDRSNIPDKDLLQALSERCPNVSITNDVAKSDFTLEARKATNSKGIEAGGFDLILFDHHGRTLHRASNLFLANAVESVCHAINGAGKKK